MILEVKDKILKEPLAIKAIDTIIEYSKSLKEIYPIQVSVDYLDLDSIYKSTKTHLEAILKEDLYIGNRDIPVIYYIALNRPTGRIFEVYGICYIEKDFYMYFNRVSGDIVFSNIANPLYLLLKQYFYRSPH